MCADCEASRINAGHWRLFDPRCLWCGVRILQQIPKFCGTTAEASQRRKAALAVWVERGHAEKVIRSLVDGPLAYAPVGKGGK
jgi:hypothetical protein